MSKKTRQHGRPPKYNQPMDRKNIHLPPSLIEYARNVGDGSLAEGVRRCIEQHAESSNGPA